MLFSPWLNYKNLLRKAKLKKSATWGVRVVTAGKSWFWLLGALKSRKINIFQISHFRQVGTCLLHPLIPSDHVLAISD